MADEKTFEKKGEDSVTTSSAREQVQLKASGFTEVGEKPARDEEKPAKKPTEQSSANK